MKVYSKFLIFLFIFNILCSFSKAEESKFGINFGGYVKTDVFYDTRQTSNLREGHFLLYPLPVVKGVNGDDINAKATFNILSIQTRLFGNITAPDAFGAKNTGYIEGEFFGTSDGDVNGFRLRHAYLKMDWGQTELLIGQTWTPMFITDCFAGVISFNTGVPFQPFARNPQIRLKQSFGNFSLYLTAFSQRDFTSIGPNGSSSIYLRNSVIPELNAKIEYNEKKSDYNLLCGLAGGYQALTPRVINNHGLDVSNEKVTGFEGSGYFKIKMSPIEFKLQGFYGQNATDLMQIGGYAVKYTNNINQITNDQLDYTPLNVFSAWSEIISTFPTNYGKFEFAVFGGYTKNLGSNDEIMQDSSSRYIIYGRNPNIDYIYRISPRIAFDEGKTRFTFETEYTTASYGTNNSKGEAEHSSNVSNLRLLLSAFLFF